MKALIYLLLLLASPARPPGETARLSLVPETIEAGAEAVLSWRVDNATQVFILGLGRFGAEDSIVVSPTTTTTYTLVAEGSFGVVTKQAILTVEGGSRGGLDLPMDFERFEYPLRIKWEGPSFVDFLDHVHGVLQDSMRFSVHAFQTPDERVTFVTNLSNRSHLVREGESRIARRRLSYLIEAEAPDSASGPIRYTLKTLIEYQRRIERTWRPEHDETMHRAEAERLRAYLQP